jgi:hypothetical protein
MHALIRSPASGVAATALSVGRTTMVLSFPPKKAAPAATAPTNAAIEAAIAAITFVGVSSRSQKLGFRSGCMAGSC